METPIFLLLSGCAVLGLAGEGLLRGAVSLATAFNVAPLIIGLTIIAFGTSAPELTVSIQAALQGQPDIAVGNVVGSNIANILLVMGTMAVICAFTIDETTLTRDSRIMLAATGVLLGLALLGDIMRVVGFLLLAALVTYSLYLFRRHHAAGDRQEVATGVEESNLPGGVIVALAALILGLGGIVWGANLMINGAVGLARQFGLSEAVIALSIVAIGTSLPELTVSIMASIRGHAGLAVGNIIGSNIANILLVLGATASLTPLPMTAEITADVWVMAAVTLLGVYFMTTGRRMERREGIVCLALYAGYLGFIYTA